MYNDYTLEQINGKLTVTNMMLDQIQVQNEALISGDILIANHLDNIITINTSLCCLVGILILFLFFIRSLL